MNLSIPQDAFSDGQVRSKLWLANSLNEWAPKYFDLNESYSLTWYGSWVGLGPFLLLSLSKIRFTEVNLVEIDTASLETSKKVLDHWTFASVTINPISADMNTFIPASTEQKQLFINTACEHIIDDAWLSKIPSGAHILLQSTNMVHREHVNLSNSLEEFKSKTQHLFTIQESAQMDVSYDAMSFSRYMLLGTK